VVRGVVESIKIITRQASLRVAKYAFYYAQLHGRKRVSAIHKANIMKKTDGLFLEVIVLEFIPLLLIFFFWVFFCSFVHCSGMVGLGEVTVL
jgi:hypothetical protein